MIIQVTHLLQNRSVHVFIHVMWHKQVFIHMLLCTPMHLSFDWKTDARMNHSVFFFNFCFTDKYLKCTGLKIGDFDFLYIFVYKSKSIYYTEITNTFFKNLMKRAFKRGIVCFSTTNIFWFMDENVKKTEIANFKPGTF